MFYVNFAFGSAHHDILKNVDTPIESKISCQPYLCAFNVIERRGAHLADCQEPYFDQCYICMRHCTFFVVCHPFTSLFVDISQVVLKQALSARPRSCNFKMNEE